MRRFDYVKYDEKAAKDQADFKALFERVELLAATTLCSPRAKSLLMTKLEEAYLWVGKAIRDDQIERNGSAPPQEERNDG